MKHSCIPICIYAFIFSVLLLLESSQATPEDAVLKFNLILEHPASPYYVRDRMLVERFKASTRRTRNWAASTPEIHKDASTTFTLPVRYSAGQFTVELLIGTPPQKFKVILDTGSDLSWVQCSPCYSCFSQADPLFDPSISRSYRVVPGNSSTCQEQPQCRNNSGKTNCEYSVNYGDLSHTVGVLSRDTITLRSMNGNTKAVEGFMFGCGLDNSGSFQKSEGILGFGQGQLSLPMQIGSDFGYTFSYCLGKNGTLLLGRVEGNFSWTPIVPNLLRNSYYYVQVTGISVNGHSLDIPYSSFSFDKRGGGGNIIDSGSTFTLLVPSAFVPLLEALKGLIPYPEKSGWRYNLDLCYNTYGIKVLNFPTVTVDLDGPAFLTIPGENLFIRVDGEGGVRCLAVGSSPFGLNVLGNLHQHNVHVVYDLRNKKIGFESGVQCSSH